MNISTKESSEHISVEINGESGNEPNSQRVTDFIKMKKRKLRFELWLLNSDRVEILTAINEIGLNQAVLEEGVLLKKKKKRKEKVKFKATVENYNYGIQYEI